MPGALAAVRKIGADALTRFKFSPRTDSPPKKISKKAAAAEARASEESFREFDVDGSGKLTFKEAREAFSKLAEREGLQSRFSADVSMGLFELMDRDDSSDIDLDEWRGAYAAYMRWVREEKEIEKEEQKGRAAASGAPGVALSDKEKRLGQEIDQKMRASASFTNVESFDAEAEGDKRPRDDATYAKVLRILGKRTNAYDSREKDNLSKAFLEANSGSALGNYGSKGGIRTASTLKNLDESLEEAMSKDAAGSIESAKMKLDAFRRMCSNSFGIRSGFCQESLFRVCRPGRDQVLSFQELMKGLAPAIKGDLEQRAAFMFILYDTDESGSFTMKELGKMHSDVTVGCVIEKDLINFSRRCAAGTRMFTFEQYLQHATDNECALIRRLQDLATS